VVYDQSRTREAKRAKTTKTAGAKDTEEVLRYASVFAVNG